MIKKEDWFTIPNILSYVRIIMIPLYIYLYINAGSLRDYYWAAAVLVLSGITDALDGIIARKMGQITDLGKVLDPFADKLTQVSVVGAMWFGKIATATFYICMFLLIIFPYIDKSQSMVLIMITAFFQLLSLFGYGHWFFISYKEEKLKKVK